MFRAFWGGIPLVNHDASLLDGEIILKIRRRSTFQDTVDSTEILYHRG